MGTHHNSEWSFIKVNTISVNNLQTLNWEESICSPFPSSTPSLSSRHIFQSHLKIYTPNLSVHKRCFSNFWRAVSPLNGKKKKNKTKEKGNKAVFHPKRSSWTFVICYNSICFDSVKWSQCVSECWLENEDNLKVYVQFNLFNRRELQSITYTSLLLF